MNQGSFLFESIDVTKHESEIEFQPDHVQTLSKNIRSGHFFILKTRPTRSRILSPFYLLSFKLKGHKYKIIDHGLKVTGQRS